MNEESRWLLEQCEQLALHAPDYEQRAFFQQLRKLIVKQDQRLQQAQGELDGRVWNPGSW
ncbi:hypothetical protein LFYK43_15720 [Ligilactobacillus salitolerans]|uniref:Uncharacterized protein n=1 Tax=Ligilactobacillus salitolerans TaxID=1808352 RepID=A0A401IU82_9LACO|nr:hypothetical protein [Ligilactobacillus salitolerans]GBG95113.1 hypothetical protein LFYK43_15720 [Ligilactobacillus salitolerans]